jgi:hypothetical protein
MSKCKRNMLLIFGYLLIVAILFIPYKYERWEHFQDGSISITEVKSGYMLFPLYFKARKNVAVMTTLIPIEELQKMTKEEKEKWNKENPNKPVEFYSFNIDIFLTEIVIILLIAGFLYILFCVVLKKEGK